MYTYKSHQKSSNRAFDYLYDPNFASNERKIQKMNRRALCRTAPLHIIPCYYNMFSESRRSEFYFPQMNGLPYDSNKCQGHNIIDTRPINYNLYSTQGASNELLFRYITQVESKFYKEHRKCQTTYRESEIQTDPYFPQPKLRPDESKLPEILNVKCKIGPYLDEIKKIERDRIRRKWEDDLRHMDISMDEKIKQLKLFEFEACLAREKEFNEFQLQRMEHVEKILEQREEKLKENCKKKLLNVYKTISMENVKEREKLKVKEDRKLRKLKHGIESTINVPKTNFSLRKTKSTILEQINHRDIEIKHEKAPMNISLDIRKPLWTPKQKTKEFEHSMKCEKFLSKIYESIKGFCSTKNNKHPKCKMVNFVDDYVQEFDNYEDPDYLKYVVLQKLIKGSIRREQLLKGIRENAKRIYELRRKFPLITVVEVLGEDFLKVDVSNSFEISEESVAEEEPKKFEQFSELQDIISDILQRALLIAQEINNRKILKKANDERLEREQIAKIEALRLKIIKMREESSKQKLKDFYDEIISEAIETIVPQVIEDISEKDAIVHVMTKAAEVTAERRNNHISFVANIKKFLTDVLIPHIESKSPDDELAALFGSYDAFNSFIEKYFSIEQ